MQLKNPQFLLLLLLWVPLVWLYLLREKKRPAVRFSDLSIIKKLPKSRMTIFRHAGIVLLGFGLPALLCWWGTGRLDALPRLGIAGALASTLGLFVLLRFGVPPELQAEFQDRAPAKAGRLLARIFGRPLFPES